MPIRGAQADLFVVQGEFRFEVIEDALRQLRGFVGLVDVGLHQGELVAPQAGEGAEAAAMAARKRSARASSNWSPAW